MTRRHLTFMALLAATWGASYMFIKIGLRDFSSSFIVFGRTALAAAVLAPLAYRAGALGKLRGHGRPIAILAVVQVAVPFLLIAEGQHHIPSALAGILVASAPIYTALLALRVDASERVTGWAAVGIGVGIVGVILLFGVDLAGDVDTILGGVMVLVASLGYSIGALYIRRTLSGCPAGGDRDRDDDPERTDAHAARAALAAEFRRSRLHRSAAGARRVRDGDRVPAVLLADRGDRRLARLDRRLPRAGVRRRSTASRCSARRSRWRRSSAWP